MTNLTLKRFIFAENETIGELTLGGEHLCYTLEDPPRDVKIKGRTCIPYGRYPLSLVQASGFNRRYQKRFGEQWHPGIVTVEDVPGFSMIRMHIGNYNWDTDGCVLVGTGYSSNVANWMLTNSTEAYKSVYPVLRDAIEAGSAFLDVVRSE